MINGLGKPSSTVSKNRNPIELVLPFFVLLAQYSIAGITAAQIAMLIAALIVLARMKLSLFFPKEFKFFVFFFIFVIIVDCCKMMLADSSASSQLNRILGYSLLFCTVFIVCSMPFSEDRLFSVWKVATVIFSLGLLLQIIQINVLHQAVEPISLLPGYSLRTESYLSTSRPMSFFREPSMFAAAIIPFLFLSLKRKDYRWAGFASIFLLASTSTVGVVACVILWLLFVLHSGIKASRKVWTIVIVIVSAILFATVPIFQDSYQKLVAVSQGGDTFSARVAVGFEVLERMSPSEYIIGAASSDPTLYINSNINSFSQTSALYYYDNGNLFLNTVAQLIFRYGIVGGILFLMCFISLLRQKEYEAKDLVVFYLVCIFFETALLNSYYFYYITLMMLYITVCPSSSSTGLREK